ncbi:hypothetical protein MTR_4g070000 [Medicago truncatula]|uniref:Uncharacterized protein n=1 Tax=Medicago truncatula TaxID=3880 RepID=G7JG58_MEDTR|nr:hypothetical protein MTR_4g070000 [Medicago truncatula]
MDRVIEIREQVERDEEMKGAWGNRETKGGALHPYPCPYPYKFAGNYPYPSPDP